MKPFNSNLLEAKIQEAIEKFNFTEYIPQNGVSKEKNLALFISGYLSEAFRGYQIVRKEIDIIA